MEKLDLKTKNEAYHCYVASKEEALGQRYFVIYNENLQKLDEKSL